MTKENIILAALRLFLHRGYNNVSLIDVANEVGITKGGIYHYFSSKERLLHTALHYLLDRFEAKYTELLSGSCLQTVIHSLLAGRVLERFAHEFLQVDAECSLDYAHFAIEIMRKFPDIQERIEQSYLSLSHSLADRIQIAREKGEINARTEPYAVAVAILSIVNGQNSLGYSFQSRAMREQVANGVWLLLAAK